MSERALGHGMGVEMGGLPRSFYEDSMKCVRRLFSQAAWRKSLYVLCLLLLFLEYTTNIVQR